MARATAIGLGAIVLWSTLALLTAATGAVPPLQLTALTFLTGGLIGALSWPVRPGAWRALIQPKRVWALGIGGLFGYHALYFTALKLAPPAEAGLVSYLWPLLIVLFAAALPGERLSLRHVLGAVLGFAGIVVLLSGRTAFSGAPAAMAGYLAAFACAFVWAGYSVLSRRFAEVSSDAVAGFCLATAALAALCHLAIETPVWPQRGVEWLAVAGLGLGPAGLAFYAWDHGVKHGDIRLLGVAAYAAPVLSTALLVAAGFAPLTWALGGACALIASGAAVASWPRRTHP